MDYAKISDEKARTATGKTWQAWAEILDRFGVKKNGHASTVKYLRDKHSLNDWWSQVVTIRYEKDHGIWKPSGT